MLTIRQRYLRFCRKRCWRTIPLIPLCFLHPERKRSMSSSMIIWSIFRGNLRISRRRWRIRRWSAPNAISVIGISVKRSGGLRQTASIITAWPSVRCMAAWNQRSGSVKQKMTVFILWRLPNSYLKKNVRRSRIRERKPRNTANRKRKSRHLIRNEYLWIRKNDGFCHVSSGSSIFSCWQSVSFRKSCNWWADPGSQRPE